MPERAMLREYFTQMRQVAENVAGTYQRVADAEADEATREKLQRIAMDTSRQVGLTDRLLEIVDE